MRLILKKARVSFANGLFNPQEQDNGSKSYNCHLLISKNSPDVKLVMETMRKAADEKWKEKGPAMFKALMSAGKVCLRNGDEKPDYEGYDEMMFLSARTTRKPKLLNKDKSPVTEDQGTLYSGCYVYAILEVKGIDKSLKDGTKVKRISCYIQGLMVVADGESLGGSTKAADEDFPDIADTGDDLGIGDGSNDDMDAEMQKLLNG